MKIKRFARKLELHKSTVANLDGRDMDSVRGGTTHFPRCTEHTLDPEGCPTTQKDETLHITNCHLCE
jgi:hypothetical protein